jgi:hypothetical protein
MEPRSATAMLEWKSAPFGLSTNMRVGITSADVKAAP